MLLENTGLSYYYSLANKFFDYVQAGVPQLCVDVAASRVHSRSDFLPPFAMLRDEKARNARHAVGLFRVSMSISS